MTVNISNFYLRRCQEKDLPGILEIVNEQITNSTTSFWYEPDSLESKMAWFKSSEENGFPIIVAVEHKENGEEKVAGYAALGKYRPQHAYLYTTELSLYCHKDYRGFGLGKRLMSEIIHIGKKKGYRTIICKQNNSPLLPTI
ncbi:uncharacterized protein VTP21DRAFT_3528 [Calcarisporiella thermophila]|uniref:uncharacterized protein n=1 Tax=Calcarisporiella thermophila TaxID=911321 RepID=UPI0037438965